MKNTIPLSPRIRVLGQDISKYLAEKPSETVDGLVTVRYMGTNPHGGYNVARIYNLNGSQPVVTHAHYQKQHDLDWLLADAVGILSSNVFPNVIEDLGNDAHGKHIKIRKNTEEDHKRH